MNKKEVKNKIIGIIGLTITILIFALLISSISKSCTKRIEYENRIYTNADFIVDISKYITNEVLLNYDIDEAIVYKENIVGIKHATYTLTKKEILYKNPILLEKIKSKLKTEHKADLNVLNKDINSLKDYIKQVSLDIEYYYSHKKNLIDLTDLFEMSVKRIKLFEYFSKYEGMGIIINDFDYYLKNSYIKEFNRKKPNLNYFIQFVLYDNKQMEKKNQETINKCLKDIFSK